MKYLNWKEEKISDFSNSNIEKMYDNGFVFTRIDKGVMHQTRSFRIDLSKFELTSENRRILKKVPNLTLKVSRLPLDDYNFAIGKMAKDFYDKKFGPNIMSAQKVKEMLTNEAKSNFNNLLAFQNESGLGYVIAYISDSLMHYSYPFYDQNNCPKDMGLAMMISALEYAKKSGLKYVYLGSLQRSSDTYKLQFSNGQWFDGKKWSDDLEEIKTILKNIPAHEVE